MRYCFVLMGMLCAVGVATPNSLLAQTQIKVTLTTTGPVGLAPALVAAHDGSYDLFDVGGTATLGLENLAEVGDLAEVLDEADMAGANAKQFAPGGPFAPAGGTGSTDLTVADTETSLTFAAMVLPSNDWFIGTSNAIDISSLIGGSLGQFIEVPFDTAYDAGTEEEDFAFAPGGPLVGITTASDPAGGTSTTDTISMVTGSDPFAAFASLEPVSFDTTSIDFTGGTIATLRLEVVPEPATSIMLLGGIVGLVCVRRMVV